MADTYDTIRPILVATYGPGTKTDTLAVHLAAKINTYAGTDDEEMIKLTCWDWFSGGSTAEAVARKIVQALPLVRKAGP